MNKKYILFLLSFSFSHHIVSMNKTAPKLYRSKWSTLWNAVRNKTPIKLGHETIINQYNALPLEQRQILNKAFQKYLNEWNTYIAQSNVNFPYQWENNILKKMNDTIISAHMVKINDLLQEAQTANYALPENLALQHFEETQARSDGHTSILQNLNESLSNATAYYNQRLTCIFLNKKFQESCPAYQYFVILHEYRHHLQNINLPFAFQKNMNTQKQKFYSSTILEKAKKQNYFSKWQIHEHDADNFACSHVTCPTCLKIIQTMYYPDNAAKLGYFSYQDIEPFIQAAEHNDCCPAHTKTTGDEEHNRILGQLNKELEEWKQKIYTPSNFDKFFLSSKFKFSEINIITNTIERLDKQSGNLFDHIPNFNRDFIRKIAEQKEFQELLGTKLLKELDVRNTMKQTEELNQKGEFPLLEESKLTGIVPEQKSSVNDTLKSEYEKPLIPERKMAPIISLENNDEIIYL